MKYLLFILILGASQLANALTLNQAKQLYLNGEYEKALPVFLENIKKSPRNASLNQWVGVCLYETGSKDKAEKYLDFAYSKRIADAALYLAQIELDKLNYGKAKDFIDEYEEMTDGDDDKISKNSQKVRSKVRRTVDMLNNVEKLQIIDSLIVDKSDFFKHYKISPEAGTLNTIDILPYGKPKNSTSVFVPESGSRMLWAMPDSTGTNRLSETYKLINGKWEKYSYLPDLLNDNGDTNYPFMMADGTTLYYACNGDNSIGGYDIFMSRKDLDTGDYLQPQNVGMPYNSPYDDYLLAIDEMTGAGWWATDRNQIPDKLTIYIFIPNDVRSNYDPEDPNISSLASVRSIKDSWTEDADYSQILKRIATANETEQTMKNDFVFHVTNDVTYTSFDDFRSSEARSLMQKHVEITVFLDKIRSQLTDLRAQFYKSNTAAKPKLSTEIRTLERTIIKNTEELNKIDNNIRAAEIPMINR